MDNNSPITRAEHEEFRRRIEDEEHRQNRRLEELEETVRQIQALTISVERLAISVQNMTSEQKRQGERLGRLEAEPAKNWSTLKSAALGALATIVVGGLVAAIINFI